MEDGRLRQSKAITGTAAQFLDDWKDLGLAPDGVTILRNLGGAGKVFPYCYFTAQSGTTPTATVEAGVADDNAGTNFIPLSKSAAVDISTATAAAPTQVPMPPLNSTVTKRRYLGWRVTLGGTTPTGTINVGFNTGKPTAGPNPIL